MRGKEGRPQGGVPVSSTASSDMAKAAGKTTLVQAIGMPSRTEGAAIGSSTLVQSATRGQPEREAIDPGLAKLEGNTFFVGHDGTLRAAAPPETAPKKTVGPTDADYERAAGVEAAIKAMKMRPVEGVHGKTFTAVGCAGKKDGKVSFSFDRALIGDYVNPAVGRYVRGAHVAISVVLDGCGEHRDVKLVQVFRDITRKDGRLESQVPDSPKRKERSGWDDVNAPSRGWQVDEVEAGTSPFYDSDPFYGHDGSSRKPGKLRDTPGEWTTAQNAGVDFLTCAVSYAGGIGTVLACVEWGYYIDDAGRVSFYPARPQAFAGALREVRDATERWDAIPGNTKANIR